MQDKLTQRLEAVDKQLKDANEKIADLQNRLGQATSIRLQLIGARAALEGLCQNP